ncbi:MAG: hypothetical protein U9R79_09040 [Armatimonadota bacterium]|nr:hypothetical protein [Armatimonadota bacterium]
MTPAGADAARTVVGCEDGTIVALDAEGEPIATAKAPGRPTVALTAEIDGTQAMLVGCDSGAVVGLGVR